MTRRSKSRPASWRRASPALPATVTRKPFSVRYCFRRLRIRVSSSTTRRCGASSPSVAGRFVLSLVSMGSSCDFSGAVGRQIVDLRPELGVDHRLEEPLDGRPVVGACPLQCIMDAARLWPCEGKCQRAALGGWVELSLPAVARPLDLDDVAGIDQL